MEGITRPFEEWLENWQREYSAVDGISPVAGQTSPGPPALPTESSAVGPQEIAPRSVDAQLLEMRILDLYSPVVGVTKSQRRIKDGVDGADLNNVHLPRERSAAKPAEG
jgi:hypothetical protein